MRIREDIKEFIKTIPNDVKVIAATKYLDAKEMENLYQNGIKDFGENRVDSFLEKYNHLSSYDIHWHFIGHLQKNKAKKIINKIEYLHSLDSIKLAYLINEIREKPLNVFLEVSINSEESKNGIKPESLSLFINELLKFKNINVVGLMMMTIKDSDHNQLLKQFSSLKTLKEDIERKMNISIPYLSMGMSDDYLEAIECGSTHIRLGRILYK